MARFGTMSELAKHFRRVSRIYPTACLLSIPDTEEFVVVHKKDNGVECIGDWASNKLQAWRNASKHISKIMTPEQEEELLNYYRENDNPGS